ncbi:MAG: TylF/MycF/NovP-related O-methyltransferase [archaeon]
MAKQKKDVLKLAKSVFIFQDVLSWLDTKVPVVLEHNLQKYSAIKKTFYMTALEELDGDYYEFGVFTGSSFVCAMRAHRKLKNLGEIKTKFFGFDSFTGFGDIAKEDEHGFYQSNIFTINEKKVLRYIRKRAKGLKYSIIKGYFEDTLKGKTCVALSKDKARIVFIDCDLKKPTELALNYVKPALQQGTMVIMDDFYSYKGSSKKGVAGAFFEFCDRNTKIKFRRVFDYGMGGVGYVVSEIKK